MGCDVSLGGIARRFMIARYIHHLRVEQPAPAETATEARERLGGKFPRGAARRMTHLGMLLGSTLDGLALSADDAIVYTTTFAETRALEDFLSSFPAASPLLFQTSIHPGGVQQVMIGRQQPAARLWPLAGRRRLVEQGLQIALLEPAARVMLVGGEEKGTWLLENKMASDRAFAFAVELTGQPEGAIGTVTFEPAADSRSGRNVPDLGPFADALAQRTPLAWDGLNGAWTIEWR
jgi:hypothetical protein